MNILVLSKVPFPDGTAASTYILNVCRTMKLCGHKVTVYGCRRNLKTDYPDNGEFEGIRYINFNTLKQNKLVNYLYDHLYGMYAVKQIAAEKNVDAVFLYACGASDAKRIREYCVRHSIKYGAFNAEWYEDDCFDATASQRHIRDWVDLIPYNAQHADLAIQISSLLTNYFRENGVPTVMIPNIVDLTDAKWNVRKEKIAADKLKLAYAGVPGVKKDELGTVVQAIALLPEEKRNNTELHVYGSDMKQMQEYLQTQGIDKIPSYVICHGRQKQDEIPAKLNECHYTVLIRESTRRTNAGFSTKMVESFAAGIPMIANITGDIAAYLKDGENGIVVADASVQACCNALLAAWERLTENETMRKAALRTAQEYFDYRKYEGVMGSFLAAHE